MKKGLIESLKEKPPRVRKLIAITVSAVIAGIVAIISMAGLILEVHQAAKLRAENPVEKENFFEQVKKSFERDAPGTSTPVVATSTSLSAYELSKAQATTTSSSTASTSLIQASSTQKSNGL